MSNIEWFSKGLDTHRSDKDVSIGVQKYGKEKDGSQKYCTCITFRNGSYMKITHGDYLGIGIDEGEKRICFREGIGSGFKLSKMGKTSTRYVRIPRLLKEYEGDYDLNMAAVGDYFYIKKED